MARNGSGTYNLLTNSWNPATNGVSATAVDWQNLINDVAAALTQSLSADGQTPITGNLNAGNNKITNLAAGTGAGQSIRWEQVFTAPASFGGGAVSVDTSGNVGIGTASPGYRLDVQATTASTLLKSTTGTNYVAHFLNNTGGFTYLGIESSTGGSLFTGTAAYSAVFGTVNAYPVALATNGTERMRIDSSGNVGIGATPIAATASRLFSAGDTTLVGGAKGFLFNMYYHTTNLRWEYAANAPCHGWIDIGSGSVAYLSTGNVSGAAGTAANVIERMRIDSSGNVLVTNNTGGLGYGTGAGGTVTQSTNKTTSVTLNRPTGQIIMNNAALAANTSVVFSLVNSLISANDLVLVCCGPGPSGVNYRIEVADIAAGNAQIRVSNITTTSLSDSVVINFAIIKGSTT